MANPEFIDCPANQWTKIATNVVTGFVHKISSSPTRYLQTYKTTGEAAPTLEADGVSLFDKTDREGISSQSGIDVYIWPKKKAGRVRVDL